MSKWKDAKDHPLFIIASVILATIIATAGFYEKFVLPQRLEENAKSAAADQIRIASEVNAAQIQEIKEKAASDVAVARMDVERAEHKLANIEMSRMFDGTSPYPVGLRRPKIGDSANTIADIFPKDKIDLSLERNGIIRILKADPIFHDVAYYFHFDDKNKIITHVSLIGPHDKTLPDTFLLEQFTNMYGNPIQGESDDWHRWKTKDSSIYLTSKESFLIMRRDYRPAFWRDRTDNIR